MMNRLFGSAMLTVLIAAAPAVADVKAGVDAWGRGDFTRAVQEWRGPAVAGDPDAQFNLGQAYKLGRGVPVDPKQAESWFRKAADQGHVQAQDNYALALFQSGRRAEAAPWLEKSIARGEPRTQLVLGTMLFNGDGVPRDHARAYALMTRASRAGLQSAGATLAQMDQFITPQERERGLALAQEYAAQSAAPPTPGQLKELPKPKRPYAPPAETTKAPPPQPAAAPRSGAWRVQFGAFRDRGNAETLWNRIRGKLAGAQPAYVKAAGVTRLQATGYASRAAAERACRAAGVSCVVVRA